MESDDETIIIDIDGDISQAFVHTALPLTIPLPQTQAEEILAADTPSNLSDNSEDTDDSSMAKAAQWGALLQPTLLSNHRGEAKVEIEHFEIQIGEDREKRETATRD